MKFRLLAFLSLLCISITGANAAIITIDRADATFSSSNLDLQAEFAALDASDIISEALPSSALIYNGSAFNNTIFKLSIDFVSSTARTMDFFAGLDAGRGAELWLNGALLNDANQNLWWSRNFNNNQVFDTTGLSILEGQIVLEVYWAENGNSGGNSFNFSVDGGNSKRLTAVNLVNEVPAPAIILLLCLGATGVFFARKK
jgi:hypothetical protein